jgi:thiol-disulfide isomerase/thioredoxin
VVRGAVSIVVATVVACRGAARPAPVVAPAALERFCGASLPGVGRPLTWPALGEGAPPDVAGKAVWIPVWATWCGPCVAELPEIAALGARLAPAGVAVQPVSIDDAPAMIERFAATHRELNVSRLRTASLDAFDAWVGTYGLPTGSPVPLHLFFGADGALRCAHVGRVGENDAPVVAAALGVALLP